MDSINSTEPAAAYYVSSASALRADAVSFSDENGKTVLTIKLNGDAAFGSDVKPNAAAKELLNAISQIFPQWKQSVCEPVKSEKNTESKAAQP